MPGRALTLRFHPHRLAKPAAAPAAALLALTLLAAACSGSTEGADSADDSSDAAQNDGTVEPVDVDGSADGDDGEAERASEDVVCPFDGPEGEEITCSTLTVPENWDTGEGEVTLTFAFMPSRSVQPAAEPIVYLEGGPGGLALDTFALQFGDLWDPLLDDYDLIFFDQRGLGYSEPSLACPSLTEVDRQAEDDPDLDAATVQDLYVTALSDCASGFEKAGIDLTQYNSINNARDADAIRQAVGAEKWNLLGISYGTKLALEIARQFPDTVSAAVIDSVYPPQVNLEASASGSFLESLDLVSAACDAEAACAAQGNLKDRLIAVAQALEANPVEVVVTDVFTGETDTVQAQGDTIVSVIAQSLYTPLGFTDFPELATDLEDGGTDALATYLSLFRSTEGFLNSGMHLAFQCNEEFSFTLPADLEGRPADPFGLTEVAFDEGDTAELCNVLGAGQAPENQNEPVVSSVPTLIMAGEFDPVTPPAWGRLAGETLENSQFVLFTGESHGVSPTPCGVEIVQEFLASPLEAVDAACSDDQTARFVAASDLPVELEPVIADFGTGETPVLQPVGWTNSNVNGLLDSRRQSSLLDTTDLIQFAGPALLSTSIEGFLAGQLGIELSEAVDADVDGTTWNNRAGDNGRVAADLYEIVDGENVQFLLLLSSLEERAALLDAVLVPAVAGFGKP